jgi:predicted adenylyl cyclase CyaB
MKKEIEVKFKIKDLDEIFAKLNKLNVKWKTPYFQTTYGFFSKDSMEKGIFPRIREEEGKTILTVKVKPKKKSRYFERKEYSVRLSDLKDGINVLKVLGFNKIRKFTKTRQKIEYKNLKLALDKLYFGNFLEIEGKKKDIKHLSKKLGYKEKDWITKAYLGLEDDYLKTKK